MYRGKQFLSFEKTDKTPSQQQFPTVFTTENKLCSPEHLVDDIQPPQNADIFPRLTLVMLTKYNRLYIYTYTHTHRNFYNSL